ncbi:chorismate mutase [Bacillus cereus VD133]|uniref:Chorismate mutase n=1 Tax=Bacillus cereus VD133 TaxID=1053233 RepID=A0A9W5PKY6_BACCE|nr:chorismate mutase [Bacillus cereus]EOO26180.1 chorismate mutase [Bacillus cereus VD133]
MDNLQVLRKKVTELDKKILHILNKRGQLVQKIGAEKNKLDLKICDLEREKELLAELKLSNEGPYSSQMIEGIFENIFKCSKELQMRHDTTY